MMSGNAPKGKHARKHSGHTETLKLESAIASSPTAFESEDAFAFEESKHHSATKYSAGVSTMSGKADSTDVSNMSTYTNEWQSLELSDATEIGEFPWSKLKHLRRDKKFNKTEFMKKLSKQDKTTFAKLIRAEREQGDMEPLKIFDI